MSRTDAPHQWLTGLPHPGSLIIVRCTDPGPWCYNTARNYPRRGHEQRSQAAGAALHASNANDAAAHRSKNLPDRLWGAQRPHVADMPCADDITAARQQPRPQTGRLPDRPMEGLYRQCGNTAGAIV